MKNQSNAVLEIPVGKAEAFLLSGEHNMGKFTSSVTAPLNKFQDTPILVQRDLPASLRDRAIKIFNAQDTYGSDAARCFFPRHGFRFSDSAREIDVLLCFECLWVYFYEAETKKFLKLSSTGIKAFIEIFAEVFPEYAKMTAKGLSVNYKNKTPEDLGFGMA